MKPDGPQVKVEFYASMREVFQEKEREIRLGGVSNIREILYLLCNTYQRRQKILDHSGQLRPDINVLKNGRNIKFLDGIETEVKEGDVIAISPPIIGG
jgi:molybdopterin synthase sulfur carrier subunit